MKRTLSIKFMWPELSLGDRVRMAAKHGFDGVELWDWRGEDVEGCAQACRETGIELTAFFGHSRGGLADPDQIDEVEAALAESIAVARRVGALQLFMFSDELSADGEMRRKPPSLIRARRMRSVVEGLRRCARLLNGTAIHLVVEAVNTYSVPGYFLSHTEDAIDVVRQVGHAHVGLVIDTFHHQMADGRLLDHVIEGLPYLSALHISDVPDRRPPGMGEIDFKGIRRVLDEHGYDGQITFEVIPVNGDSEGAVAAIKKALPF
jgi:hydroxypyruvate isomerase